MSESISNRGRKLPCDEATIRRLWASDLRNDHLAEALGVPHGWLETIRERYGLPIRRHHAPRNDHKADPTDQEIEERAATIRAGWTPAEAERRWQLGSLRAECKQFAFDGRVAAFSAIDT